MLHKYRTQRFQGLILLALMMSLAACAPDVDYKKDNGSGDVDPNAALAACQAQVYLTLDCIDLLSENADQVAEEQAAVTLANDDLNDVLDCYSYEIVETEEVADEAVVESDAEAVTTATVSCESVAINLLAGFDVCVSMAEDFKYYECNDIEDAVNDAVSLCDASAEDITVDFCSLINPTTDTTTE